MTDEEMDARLRAAGVAWRAATETTTIPAPSAPPAVLPPGSAAKRRPTAWLIAAAVVVTALVAAGAFAVGRTLGKHEHPAANSATLRGTVWQLLGRPGETSTASFYLDPKGNLVADDTCEVITGHAAVDGDRLRVSRLDERPYYCTDAVGEVAFLDGITTLRNDPTWKVTGDRLTLSGRGPSLHFAAAPDFPVPTADRPTITGTTWQLVKIVDANRTEHDARGSATLRIVNGRLTASDTCNTITGRARVAFPHLQLGNLSATEIGCADGTAASTVVDQVLTDGAELQPAGPTLTITKPGAGTLTYQWKPTDEQATDRRRLTATPWRLASVGGKRTLGQVTLEVSCPPGSHGCLTTQLYDNVPLRVSASCGNQTTVATIGHGWLRAAGLPERPKAGCPDELSTVDSFLHGTSALWRIQGDRLVIDDGGAQASALGFTAVHATAAADGRDLLGSWTLTGGETRNGNDETGWGISVTPGQRAPGVTFSSGHVRINHPCYTNTAAAAVGSGTLDVTSVKLLRGLPCPSSGVTRIDHQLDDVLTGRSTWRLAGSTLKITKGTTTLEFERLRR
jgi:heat shock protein HslJ